MSETALWTFQDATDWLADVFDADKAKKLRRVMLRAVDTAYRDLPNKTRWSYFTRRRTLRTAADQTTGTIAYDHTGGSSERLVTLTGATFPTDAALYRMIIDGVHYDISSYVSSTTVTLSPNNNPGADVDAGATYALYRASYPLPTDFRKLLAIFDVEQEQELQIVSNTEQHRQSVQVFDNPGIPWFASIRNSEYYGGLSLIFSPPPDSARQYDLLYEASPRALSIEKYSTGTAAITAGQTTLTITGGTLPTNCAGSILRLTTSTTNEPTGKYGALVSGSDVDNPYLWQRTILSRDNSTTCTLDATVDQTLSGVKYTISDPIDIEPGAMFTAFIRMAEAEYAKLVGKKEMNWQLREQHAAQAVRYAMENENRAPNADRPPLLHNWWRNIPLDTSEA